MRCAFLWQCWHDKRAPCRTAVDLVVCSELRRVEPPAGSLVDLGLLSASDCGCPRGPGGVRPQRGPGLGCGPVLSRTPPALWSSATRDRSAGRARQGRCKPHPSDPLLPKPVRAGLSPGKVGNDPAHACHSVVRGCPLGSERDRCEWHASGTAGEDDLGAPWRRWLYPDRRVRPVLGAHRVVGKPRTRRGSPAAISSL
jgi:hypothetical protein